MEMINVGVQREIKEALKEVNQRLEVQEQINVELEKQLSSVVGEMGILKAAVENQPAFPVLPKPQGPIQESEQVISGGWIRRSGNEVRAEAGFNNRLEEICAAGRKVVGFTPIEPRMLELQMNSFG